MAGGFAKGRVVNFSLRSRNAVVAAEFEKFSGQNLQLATKRQHATLCLRSLLTNDPPNFVRFSKSIYAITDLMPTN
jgi:hypothetical protein